MFLFFRDLKPYGSKSEPISLFPLSCAHEIGGGRVASICRSHAGGIAFIIDASTLDRVSAARLVSALGGLLVGACLLVGIVVCVCVCVCFCLPFVCLFVCVLVCLCDVVRL